MHCSRNCHVSQCKVYAEFYKRESNIEKQRLLPKAELIGYKYRKSIDHGGFYYAFGLMPVFRQAIFTTSNGLFNPKREQNILLGSPYNESQCL